MKQLLCLMFAVMSASALHGQSMQQYIDSVMYNNQINPNKALDFGLAAISKGYNENWSTSFYSLLLNG